MLVIWKEIAWNFLLLQLSNIACKDMYAIKICSVVTKYPGLFFILG